ncbi:GGDEF domain-containing protein [Noviherbaspirillum sp. UKPF54]|uniref:GGDEF domain-containing protein n=1 Tax=Noviherbaspirillum sp. UKPF54 TaxID=2601898 RepID=UPI0011B11A0C|nr:GGDEF domain-containing protein [Noviherbaspirillum sp. UKPF54]QDZ26562.1 GGDEF domain-containing protein [Noviherbaspirillum sp. UKPF54]
MKKFRWLTRLLSRKSPIGSEFGQAKLRVMNVTPFCLYLILAWYRDWHAVPANVAIGALGYILYAVLWVFVVQFSILNIQLRRTLAAILDQALPAIGMYLAGFLAGLVAWVPALGSIGSGMRFGTRYAWLSSAVGGPAMGAAFFFSSDWRSIPGVAAGIVLVNVLLPLYVVVLVKRLEEEKSAFESRVAHLEVATKHDPLTGLLNRAGFGDVLEELRAADTKPGEKTAVLVLDLDGFKAINDACGHAAGDTVLKAVAASLVRCVRHSDKVARLGGDEFGIALRHVVSEDNAERLAAGVLSAIERVVTPRDDLRLGASVGICMLPNPELHTNEAIIEAADRLMYKAKAEGKNQFRMCHCG